MMTLMTTPSLEVTVSMKREVNALGALKVRVSCRS